MKPWVRTTLVIGLLAVFCLGTAMPAAADSTVHTVQAGETLASIARQYGVSTTALAQANGLSNINFIWYGQRLIIPGSSSSPGSGQSSTYVVRYGDTLYSIATNHGVSLVSLAQANGITHADWIYVGQRLTIPSAGTSPEPSPAPSEEQWHRVQPGEYVASIAARYGTTAAAVARANGLSNPELVYVGQLLRIPSGTPAAPEVSSGGGLRFYVYISQQHCYLYRDGGLLYDWACSTGRAGAATVPGSYRVQSKIRNAWGSAFYAWMPYWLGIYWAGNTENGIHALPIDAGTGTVFWANSVGTPVTFGCIMLENQAAITLWNLAYIGMPVVIQP